MLKYVLDEETKLIKTDGNGLPLVLDDSQIDSEPFGLDGIGLHTKVPSLQKESKERRTALNAAKKELSTFQDLGIDIESYDTWKADATKALDTIKNLEDNKLVEANKVEDIKKQVRDEVLAEKARSEKQYKDLLAEREASLNTVNGQVRSLVVDNQFHSSKYIPNDLIVTPTMARKIFGDNFKAEMVNNKTQAVGYMNGEPVMSKSNVGEFAPFEEALKHMIDTDPDRDAYIKADSKKSKQEPDTPVSFQSTEPGETRTSTDKIRAGLAKLTAAS